MYRFIRGAAPFLAALTLSAQTSVWEWADGTENPALSTNYAGRIAVFTNLPDWNVVRALCFVSQQQSTRMGIALPLPLIFPTAFATNGSSNVCFTLVAKYRLEEDLNKFLSLLQNELKNYYSFTFGYCCPLLNQPGFKTRLTPEEEKWFFNSVNELAYEAGLRLVFREKDLTKNQYPLVRGLFRDLPGKDNETFLDSTLSIDTNPAL